MKKQQLELDGPWEFKEFPETARRMRDLDTGDWQAASVPSSIYTCLDRAGQIDSADLTANPQRHHWISQKSWIFRKQFDVSPDILNSDRVRLVFDGLDTIAHIWLNGKLLGKVENMFIPHRFDITGHLEPTGNIVHVKFLPALERGTQLMQRYGKLSEHHFGDPRRCYLRKAQYQFGSVLAPAMPGCGIFRSVRIEADQTAQLEDIHVRTVDCNQQLATLRLAVSVDRTAPAQMSLTCKLSITGGGLQHTEQIHFSADQNRHALLVSIDRPILWWPQGCGVPHRYHLKTELYDRQTLLDVHEMDFGIRTIRLDRSADHQGHRFQFIVNDRPITIKGANWMPLSMISTEPSAAHYDTLLKQAAEAHINMLRVWGGGLYEAPLFYQCCDERGLLVWQDFMFANAYYPDRQWFLEMVRTEARDVITRLRNHPSLALWCGNSRIDSLHKDGRLGTGRKFFGKAIYHEILPGLLNELDPDREYIPSTPFSESPASPDNDPCSGTTHSWSVWNNFADETDYETPPEATPRFVTEFGLQSLPNRQTVTAFNRGIEPQPGSLALEKMHLQPGGPARLARYAADHFPPPQTLAAVIRQSQLVQARAAKRFVEHLRSNPTANAGCMIWTFNDTAASINFSAIDMFGRPKALYYYARRFFAPVLVTLMQSENGLQIQVINDSGRRITGTVTAHIMEPDGTVADQIERPMTASPRSLAMPCPLPKSFSALRSQAAKCLYLSVNAEQQPSADNVYFFAPDKYRHSMPGTIDLLLTPANNGRWQLELTSETVVRDVQVIPSTAGQLSDNFFTLLPGRPKQVRFAPAADAHHIRPVFELQTGRE